MATMSQSFLPCPRVRRADIRLRVWGVENSGDDLTRKVGTTSTDIHINNPAEELNYRASLSSPSPGTD